MEERRQKLADMFNKQAPVGKTLGARLYYKGESAVVELPYNPAVDTAGGNVHGGIGALLLDTALVRLHNQSCARIRSDVLCSGSPQLRTLTRGS